MKLTRSIFSARSTSTAIAIAIAVSCVQAADTARWVMSFPSPTNNATEFERRYGGVAFLNRVEGGCSSCMNNLLSTSDSSGRFARWEFANPAAARVDYQDVGGILLPLDPEWSWKHDLRKSTGLRIKVRSKVRSEFRLGLEGPAAPFASVGVQPEIVFSAGPKWQWIDLDWSKFQENQGTSLRLHDKTVHLSLADSMGRIVNTTVPFLNRPSWASNAPSDSVRYESDSGNVLKNVRSFKIIPQISSMVSRSNLDIDSIVIAGIAPQWGRIRGSNRCQGRVQFVDQFDESRGYFLANNFGGPWEFQLDSSSQHPEGISVGNSSLYPQARDPRTREFVAAMAVELRRSEVQSHPRGGWARLSTWLAPDKSPRSHSVLKAISFRIQAGETSGFFDTTAIHGVTFRLHSSAVDDSVPYSVRIPYDNIRPASGDTGRTVCIDLDELRQEGWYTGKAGIRTIDPSTLTGLSWTLSLNEPTANSAAPSRLILWDAAFWSDGTSDLTRPAIAGGLTVRATNGSMLVQSRAGRNLYIEFRDLAGRTIATRSIVGSGSQQSIAIPRANGVLLVSVADGFTQMNLRVVSR
ncbi:MAG: hypothetical protein IPK50_23820 [Fibrobacterota bacterium]|nr:MAG: hypothetical protein IPK50_23820 [Fibrobacterota bacterium]